MATAARRRRRNRLRATAVPTRRPTAYANRGGVPGSPSRKVTVIGPRRTRRPRSRKAPNVLRSRILHTRAAAAALAVPRASVGVRDPPVAARPLSPPGDADPCACGPGEWLDPHGSPSGGGIRGSWPACACSAGKFVSPIASPVPPKGPAARRARRRGRSSQGRCRSMATPLRRAAGKVTAVTDECSTAPRSPR